MTNIMVANKNHFASLKKDEKISFITILCMLAAIDENIRQEEIDYIKELADSMEIELQENFFTYPKELGVCKAARIKNRHTALELIKNMFALAYTDNTFTDSEGHFICAISEALKIEPQKVSEISSWIIDRIIWLEQASLIFEETPQPNGGAK
ncbi:MAG: TerB family tellurite resistance protein [Acetobacter sp.]|nr:TerB family tellurite resistance protein [Acetobacter sp.]